MTTTPLHIVRVALDDTNRTYYFPHTAEGRAEACQLMAEAVALELERDLASYLETKKRSAAQCLEDEFQLELIPLDGSDTMSTPPHSAYFTMPEGKRAPVVEGSCEELVAGLGAAWSRLKRAKRKRNTDGQVGIKKGKK